MYVSTVYSPVNKNPQFFRQRSSDKKPSLPRDGAHKMAKQISNMKNVTSQEFLKTPDAGMSGLVAEFNLCAHLLTQLTQCLSLIMWFYVQ